MPVRDIFLIIVICLVWSFNFTAGAAGMQHFSPALFMILRFLLVLVLLAPFLRLPPGDQWFRLISVCLLVGTLHFTTMFWALGVSSDVSSVAIVQQTYIPMAVLLAMFILREKVGWRTMAATGIAFVGVLVLGFDPMVLSQPKAFSLALLSALFQALGSIYMRGIRNVGVMNFQAWTAIISLPFLIFASLIFEDNHISLLQEAGTIHWASVIYSVVMASILGHGLFYYMVQKHPISAVMPYMLLTPVFAVAFGIGVWGDRPGWRLLCGGALVLTGILFITLRARRKFTSKDVSTASPRS
jgi:O-acetylserine/cysteine efflux transporter